jgi:hypothetical protein
MERPNRTANIIIGTKLTTGIDWSMPSRLRPQPHWKITTMTP